MTGKKRRKPTPNGYAKDLERNIAAYILATNDQAWTTYKIADWLIATGQWEDQKINATRYLARQLSRAARQTTFTDDDGNRVRKYHAYRLGPDQPMLWSEIDRIKPEQMNESKTMRRNKLASGAIQLYLDLDHYNKRHNPGEWLKFDSDFTKDIQERGQPNEYDDIAPGEPSDN